MPLVNEPCSQCCADKKSNYRIVRLSDSRRAELELKDNEEMYRYDCSCECHEKKVSVNAAE